MSHPENNIAWVYDNPDGKKLISADFRPGTNLEKELNISEQCEMKLDGLEKICNQRAKQLDATMVLLVLQWKIEKNDSFNDIDLIYDPKLDSFRYRLFDQNDLIIPIDLDNSLTYDQTLNMTKLEKFWEIVVELINNIHKLEFENDNLPSYKNYQEISSENFLLFNSHIVSSESLKEIFYFNPNEEYPGVQANNMLNKIKDIIIDAQKYRKNLLNKNVEIH